MTPSHNARNILVIGGYGATGTPATLTLAEWFPGDVIVAGRDLDKARALADTASGDLTPLRLDTDEPANLDTALQQSALVVMCADRNNEQVARACIERGITYIDLSASAPVLASIERLDDLARAHSTTVVLSVGLAPGITNLLARYCRDQLEGTDQLDITILLGLGEHHGHAALGWTLQTLSSPTPQSASARVQLPGYRRRRAHPFAFSDQYTLARTLDVNNITTRLCFDSAPTTTLLFAARRVGAFRIARRLRLTHTLTAMLARIHLGRDDFAVQVEATNAAGFRLAGSVTGHRQSAVTGLVAAHLVKWLRTHHPPAGVHHIEQLVDTADFLEQVTTDHTTFSLSRDRSAIRK